MLLGAASFLLASRIGRVLCALQNVSIDDQNGDPLTNQQIQYSAHWSFGPQCSNCKAKVDPPTEPFDQTWHDTSFVAGGPLISASATFTGSAVYVVCILTGTSSNPNGNSDMTFLLDGEEAGTFQKSPDGNPAYLFDSVVFSMDSLPMTEHNITLVAGQSGKQSLVLLDRIIYTTQTPDETPSGQDPNPSSGSEQAVGDSATGVLTEVIIDEASKKTVVSTATETSDVTQSVTETASPSISTNTQAVLTSSSSQSHLSPTSRTSNTKPVISSTQTSSSHGVPAVSGGSSTGLQNASAGHNHHAVAIALGVLGSIIALVGAAFGFFLLRNRRLRLQLKAAPWFERLSVASGDQQTKRNSSLSMGASRVSAASLHGEVGTTIRSFYAGSISQTEAGSESKPPSYEATDSETSPNIPVLEKF